MLTNVVFFLLLSEPIILGIHISFIIIISVLLLFV